MAHKILLADDSITIQKVVNLTFTDEGIDVVTVGNGELALKKLREDAYDLVLADIFMPGRNGYEVCEYVKSQPQLSRVPVILLVGAFEPFDRSEASRVRADGHLTKPFESRILVETVKRMLAQAQPRPDEQPAQPRASAWAVPPSDLTPVGDGEIAPPSYDPYASTAKIPPYTGSAEAGSEQTMVIGSPFSAPDAESEGRLGHSAGDVFQFNLSAPLPGTPQVDAAPGEGSPEAGSGEYTTQPHAPFEQETGYEEGGETPGTAAFGGMAPEAPSWDVPSAPPFEAAHTADFGAVESHSYEPAFVPETREPLLDTFDRADQEASGATDPDLVTTAQPDGEPSMNVGPVDGLTTGWDAAALPAGFRQEAEREVADTTAQLGSESIEQAADDEAISGKTQAYSPQAMRPFDAAEPEPAAEDHEPTPAPRYEANRTQAYRFDLAPFLGAEQDEVESAEASEAVVGAADVAASDETIDELPIEIEEAPEMPETPPPPPSSLPEATFNFDPTRTQAYEFGLPPFEEAEELVAEPEAETPAAAVWGEPAMPEALPSEPSPAEPQTAALGSGTGDLDFTPPPPPISEEPLEAAFADTAPLRLGKSIAAYGEEASEETAEAIVEDEVGDAVTASEEPVEVAESAESVADAEGEAVGLMDDVAEPTAPSPVAAGSTNGAGAHPADGMDLLGVPSDIIDEVVRRTVERMSDDVIREIAWEVVPDLAARMIKKHLEEGR
jgi:CheY-like chemotaxis protein